MRIFFIFFVAILITLCTLDAIWLGIMAKRFFSVHIGHLMSGKVKFMPVILFYLLYAFALTIFVGMPAFKGHYTTLSVFFLGLLFGLTAYGTFDLTNHAIMKNWPTIMTIVDMGWGSLLTGFASVAALWITNYFIE